jgi:hypothetical protein
MNEFFGSQLRRELIDLMGRSEFLRARTQSTGSQRLSIDSDGSLDGNDLMIKTGVAARQAKY